MGNRTKKAVNQAIVVSCLVLILSTTSTINSAKVQYDYSTWYWAWRQPPYTIVRDVFGYPYIFPAAGIVMWGGQNHDVIFTLTYDTQNYSPHPHGIYKSTDNAFTWEYVGDVDPNNPMNSIVIHPVTSTLMLAGGQNYYPPGGIYRSENEGATWTNVLSDKIIYDIEIDPTNPNRVYASTCCLSTGTGGIYRSEDAGTTWNQISDQWLEDLEAHPTLSNVVFGVRWFSTNPDEGIYRSEDAGVAWVQIANLEGQKHIVVDDHNPDRMFAYGRTYGGIWRTDNGGTEWINITMGLPAPIAPQTILSLTFDPTSPDTIWVGLKYGGMFVSNDAGGNWTEVNLGIPFVGASIFGPQCITSAFGLNGRAAIGCDGRVYVNLILDKRVFLPMVIRQ